MKTPFITPGSTFECFPPECVEQSVPERLDYIVERFPDRLAISTRECQYSYRQMVGAANRVAHALLDTDCEASLPLAVLIEQGPPQIIASLGILKAGMFYVPLDPFNPSSRNQHMLEDSGATVIITNDRNLASARAIARHGQMIINVDHQAARRCDTSPSLTIAPTSIAYVLYTSGSTGQPKGIIQNHRNILHNVMRHTNGFCICPDDRQTLLYTSSVYGGQRDMYNAILNGASLHVYVVKKEGIAGLADWITTNGITIYCSVATIFRQFAGTLTGKERFDNVRLIKLGGEASHKRDVELFQQYFSRNCIMHCGLGSTETGLVRNYFVSQSTRIQQSTVPLGYPEKDLDVLLLNEAGKEMGNTGVGEIAVRSRYVALGYWKNPALTSQVFSTDPADPEIRIYRTGDLGQIQGDGLLHHRGRKDFQIKIRGNRIEVAEIEMTLLAHDNVKSVVVVGLKDHQGIDKLAAYVVTRNGSELDSVLLRQTVAAKLPDYMVPSYFICLPELPLLPNGKIDRSLLPKPDFQSIRPATPYVQAEEHIEKKLVEIWASILSIPKIGVTDNFFELGGDSLSAVMMLAEIEKQLGVKLPTTVLTQDPTIANLATTLRSDVSRIDWPVVVSVKQSGIRPPLFCVHGVFGSTLFARSLGALLDDEQPLYALQSPRLDGKYFSYHDVREIATFYLEQLMQIQPEGPYYLSGFSFGGLVAYDMARQLTAHGQHVGKLIIFDSTPPSVGKQFTESRVRQIFGIPREIINHSAKAMARQRVIGVRTSLLALMANVKSASIYLKYLCIHAFLRLGFTLPVMLRDEYLAWNHYRIGKQYHAEPCDAEIVLFCTEKKERRLVAAWQKASTKRLISYVLTCEHWDLFKEPHINFIAKTTNKHLHQDLLL